MAFQSAHGYFEADINSGTQDISPSGITEKIRVVHIYGSNLTLAQAGTSQIEIQGFHGWHVGDQVDSGSSCVAFSAAGGDIGQANAICYGYWDETYAIRMIDSGTGATIAYGSISVNSPSDGDFQITWEQNPPQASLMFYDVFAWGDSDNYNAGLKHYSSPSGTKPVVRTDSGIAFVPDACFTHGASVLTEGGFDWATQSIGFGGTDGTTTRQDGLSFRNGNSEVCYYIEHHDADATIISCQTGGTAQGWGQFVQFIDSGTGGDSGIQLSWTTPQTLVAGYRYTHVFLRGLNTYVGDIPDPTTTGLQSINVGFAPEHALLFASNRDYSTSQGYVAGGQQDAQAIGSYDGTNQNMISFSANQAITAQVTDISTYIFLDSGLGEYLAEEDNFNKQATIGFDTGNQEVDFDFTFANSWVNGGSWFAAFAGIDSGTLQSLGSTAVSFSITWADLDSIPEGAISVWEQFGFLFRLDDGDEDTATAAKPEDQFIVTQQGETSHRRLRIGLKNTGAAATGYVRLQINKTS